MGGQGVGECGSVHKQLLFSSTISSTSYLAASSGYFKYVFGHEGQRTGLRNRRFHRPSTGLHDQKRI
jgi:hypothetical protein